MAGLRHRVPLVVDREVDIHLDDLVLHGTLALPERAAGLVVFAHGSGSSRLSPRNRAVAEVLQEAGVGTLLVDLLAEEVEPPCRKAHRRLHVVLLGRPVGGKDEPMQRPVNNVAGNTGDGAEFCDELRCGGVVVRDLVAVGRALA